jgi:DNA-binding CsgD family transcriptional regulator/PAS domain-containing protein
MTAYGELPERLLDLIYDAATDQELWRSVLTEIADLTNGQCGILFGQSISVNELYFSYNGRCDEAYNDVYRARHMQNPWAMAMERQPVGRVVFSDEIVELSSVRPTLFFDEILRPQDVPHNAMVALAAKDGFRAAFNICRSARRGPFSEDERRLLDRLVPHLRRSIQLAFRIDGYRALQRAGFDVLDRLAVGVILLDRGGRILYVNTAASLLGADEGPLRLRNAMVATCSPSHSQQLRTLIEAALRGTPAASMSVPRPNDGQLVTILVSSVRGQDIGRFADLSMPDAAVLLFIIDPANRAGIPMSWIMDGYGLTQAEAKVALAASSGLGVPETASRLGVSANTIKTHLRRVFAKTGTSRQTELVRLMASIGLLRADSPTSSDET